MFLISKEFVISHASGLWNTVSRLHSHVKGRAYVLLSPVDKLLASSAAKAEPYVTSLRQVLAPLGRETPLLCGSLTALSVVTDRFFCEIFEKTPFIKSSDGLKTSARLLVNFFVLKSVVRLTALPMNNVGVAAVVVVAMTINVVWNQWQKLQDVLGKQSILLNSQSEKFKAVDNLMYRNTELDGKSVIINLREEFIDMENKLEALRKDHADISRLKEEFRRENEGNSQFFESKIEPFHQSIVNLVAQLKLNDSFKTYLSGLKNSLTDKKTALKNSDSQSIEAISILDAQIEQIQSIERSINMIISIQSPSSSSSSSSSSLS